MGLILHMFILINISIIFQTGMKLCNYAPLGIFNGTALSVKIVFIGVLGAYECYHVLDYSYNNLAIIEVTIFGGTL